MSLPETLLAELRACIGPKHVLTGEVDVLPYRRDGTAILRHPAEAVIFPATTAEVAACMKAAAAHRVPVVTRGSGTGLSGGSIPVEGGLVMCLLRMDQILGIDPANLTLRVQPGVRTVRLDAAAAEHGLFYPPDPGSMAISTIGGNIAENAGGLRGLKYGVTRNYVMELEVVLASGEIVRLGSPCVKDVAGYSLKDVFIGSEGTLGIVTEILLRLLPRPAARKTMLALYEDIGLAAETVSAIIAAKIIPCTLEFLDQTTLRAVEDHAHIGLPTDCGALLLMETDGHPVVVAEQAATMEEIARRHGAREFRLAQTAEEGLKLAEARRAALSVVARVRPTTILEDVTVPRTALAEMVKFIAETARRHQLHVANFGHMGDGNLHPTFLTNERDADEMARVHAALEEIVAKTLALGGTITGEHGVGLAKKQWLRQQLGETSHTLLRAFKRAVDPHQLLNPGKILD